MSSLINISYLLSCVLLILSIRSLASPKTAKTGNLLGIIGITSIIATSFISLKIPNIPLTIAIIILGAGIGVYSSMKVKITALPQMIAIFNGLGGLAAVCIALSEALSFSQKFIDNTFGLIIGGITFSGSLIAFAKLQNIISSKDIRFPFQYTLTLLLTLASIIFTIIYINTHQNLLFIHLACSTIILGALVVLPIGGADMPVIISILNGCSGWATVGIGLSLNNTLLIIIGTIVGAGGTILAYIMMKAMNRSIINILTGGFSSHNQSNLVPSNNYTAKSGSPEDAAFIMENANKIIIIPGYGMAASQAQHSLKTMVDILQNKYGVDVKYAIHPVAGRMPGHMNVLLAEANVDYKEVFEMNDINNEFSSADVAFIIGANDITNPIAKTDINSPLYGMPILDVEKAKTIFFVKRSLGSGYSGVDNPLFYASNTYMLYGDAKDVTEKIIKALEQ